jgi:hypothetical protein
LGCSPSGKLIRVVENTWMPIATSVSYLRRHSQPAWRAPMKWTPIWGYTSVMICGSGAYDEPPIEQYV